MSNDLKGKLSTDGVVSFHELIGAVLERIWVIALCLVLSIFAGLSWISRTPVVYSTSVTLEMQPSKDVVDIKNVNKDETGDSVAIQTMLQLIRSQPFLLQVANALHLTQDRAFFGTPEGVALNVTPEAAAGALSGLVEAKLQPGTRLIDISVEHSDPATTQKVADGIAREFIRYNMRKRSTKSETAVAFLEEQTASTKQKLEVTEQALQAYKEKNQTASLSDGELSSFNARVSEANRLRLALESDLSQIQLSGNDPGKLLGLESISSDPTVTTLKAGIAKWQEQIANMQQRYTEKHPKLIRARKELAALQQALNDAALRAIAAVQPRYDSALAQEKSLEDQALQRNRNAIDYNVLVRDVETNRTLYESLLKRIKETDVTKAIEDESMRVVQYAMLPGAPIKPNKKKMMMTSVGSGLAAGLFIAFAFYFLDSTIKRVDKAESLFRLPVLTVVPESKMQKKAMVQRGLSDAEDIEATVKESFRSLIVALNLLGGPPGRKICLFTSSVPEEGKSFCSYHSAVHLASQGKKTLLIDCDLRRPSQHHLMGQKADLPGVSDVLAGQKTITEVTFQSPLPNLFYIPAGSRSPNPLKLISDGNFKKIIDGTTDYDYVVLDTAPINAVADTLLLTEYSHQICLIIRSGKTSTHMIRRALQLIATSKKEPSGIILNRFLARRGAYYYYTYSYHKTYGPDGVYGGDRKKTG